MENVVYSEEREREGARERFRKNYLSMIYSGGRQ